MAASREKRCPLPKSAHGLVSEKTSKSITTKNQETDRKGAKETSRNSHKKTGWLVVYGDRLNLCSNHRNSDSKKEIYKIRKVGNNRC